MFGRYLISVSARWGCEVVVAVMVGYWASDSEYLGPLVSWSSPSVLVSLRLMGVGGSSVRSVHLVMRWSFDSRPSQSRVVLVCLHDWSFCPWSVSMSAHSFPHIPSWDGVHCTFTLQPTSCSVMTPSRHSLRSSVAGHSTPLNGFRAPWLSAHIVAWLGFGSSFRSQSMPSQIAWISASRMSAWLPMLQCPS